jgi:hypothetical protein
LIFYFFRRQQLEQLNAKLESKEILIQQNQELLQQNKEIQITTVKKVEIHLNEPATPIKQLNFTSPIKNKIATPLSTGKFMVTESKGKTNKKNILFIF